MKEGEEAKYVAYQKDNNLNFREFATVIEVAEFFGVKKTSIYSVATGFHRIKGEQSSTWLLFSADASVIDVESELETRLQ